VEETELSCGLLKTAGQHPTVSKRHQKGGPISSNTWSLLPVFLFQI